MNFHKPHAALLAAVLAMMPAPLLADPPPVDATDPGFILVEPEPIPHHPTPAALFGNYAGAGKCPPNSPKPCIDTGAMDNVFVEHHEAAETHEDALLRYALGIKKTDARVAIRILRDHGQSCAFQGEMYWAGDHLEFQDKPPYGLKICKLQIRFKNGVMEPKDPGKVCSWKFCSFDMSTKLEGRRFKQGPDSLLTASKKSAAPPPAAIFGRYTGTGQCATDERKIDGTCDGNKSTDYIIIEPSDTADARVTLGSPKRGGTTNYFCLREADTVWLGNHLAFVKEMPETPGRPHLVEFWFKNDTVVVSNVYGRSTHCGTDVIGELFKKAPAQSKRNTQQ